MLIGGTLEIRWPFETPHGTLTWEENGYVIM